jgi:hypothetical protein
MNIKIRPNQLCFASALFVALTMTAYSRPTSADALDVSKDGIIDAQINGYPIKLQVRGDWISYPTLNPDAIQRLGIRSNIFANMLGIQAVVGTTVIAGHTGKAKFLIEGKEINERALWFDRPAAPQLEGMIGPASLPQSQIRLNTGIEIEHAAPFSVPMQIYNNRVGTQMSIDGTPVFVMFDPLRQYTIASAAAGQVISNKYGGNWSGASSTDAGDFGIDRPVRTLNLANPIEIGSLHIQKMLVRDYSRVKGITDDGATQDILDPNEVTLPPVTVTANVKSKVKPLYYLTLGRDALDHCANITFNKGTNQIEFTCE